MENKEKSIKLYIRLKYNDKDITVNGTHIHKKADENGPDVEGDVALKYFFIEDYINGEELKNLEEWCQKALDNKFSDKNFYQVDWNGKSYIVPLTPPKNVNEDVKEEMYYYGKDKYFDLDMACEHLRAEKEIPEKIRKMEVGEEFNFVDLFKDYIIVSDNNEECFEIYCKVVGQLVGQIKVKKELGKPDQLEKNPYSFIYVRI